ncbi:MAG: amidohydrolase family protein [Patulibacter sp.]
MDDAKPAAQPPRPLIVDAVCHPYNFTAENQRGRYGQMFTDVMWSAYPYINPPDQQMTREQWTRDWGTDEFIETMLLESETDICCVHTLPIFDAYRDGLVAMEKGAELKRRFPDRVIWYASADLFRGEEALESLEYQVRELGADGIKMYPAQYVRGRTRYWEMGDDTFAYPVFELAQELGIKNIAVHKALPLGPVSTDSMRVHDIGRAAARFPDLNFQIVHAGFMFMDETRMLLMNHPNVHVTLEVTFVKLLLDPAAFGKILGGFLAEAGPERVLYSSAATNPHPRFLLEAFADFELPDDVPATLDARARELILGGNLLRMHGIDPVQRRAALADDEFARRIAADGRREPWSTVMDADAAKVEA